MAKIFATPSYLFRNLSNEVRTIAPRVSEMNKGDKKLTSALLKTHIKTMQKIVKDLDEQTKPEPNRRCVASFKGVVRDPFKWDMMWSATNFKKEVVKFVLGKDKLSRNEERNYTVMLQFRVDVDDGLRDVHQLVKLKDGDLLKKMKTIIRGSQDLEKVKVYEKGDEPFERMWDTREGQQEIVTDAEESLEASGEENTSEDENTSEEETEQQEESEGEGEESEDALDEDILETPVMSDADVVDEEQDKNLMEVIIKKHEDRNKDVKPLIYGKFNVEKTVGSLKEDFIYGFQIFEDEADLDNIAIVDIHGNKFPEYWEVAKCMRRTRSRTFYLKPCGLAGGGKRAVGGKAKEKMDKETKVKELMETVGTSLLRITASNPPDFIKNTVANIVQLKDQLTTKPDLVMDGLRTLPVGEIIKLQTGLSSSHSYLRVSATAKALYPTEHIQMEEIGKLCGYTMEAMKGFVELCLLSHYSDDDGVIRWQKMGADLIEIASKNGGTATGSADGAGNRGLGY